MSQFTKITQLPQSLIPVYLTEESFWNRFFKISRIEDPFARVYDICDDIFHNNTKVAVKDYGSNSIEQCQNVTDNLQFYRSIEEIGELCKLVAFCQEEATGDIKAAFQYSGFCLQDILESHQFKENSQGFYMLLLKELFGGIRHFKTVGINLEDLVSTNILLQRREDCFRVKILYDERQKKYDKIQEGLKTFCSPQKINSAINESQQIFNENSQEIIFELGLLLLDVMYLYQSTSEKNLEKASQQQHLSIATTNKPSSFGLSSSTLFKGYHNFEDYTTCTLNRNLIQSKVEYLLGLNNYLITQFVIMVKKMLNQGNQRITYQQLEYYIESLLKITKKQSNSEVFSFRITTANGDLSPIKSRQSSVKIQDSLKYSDSRQQKHSETKLESSQAKKTILTHTTVPTSLGILDARHEIEAQHQFCIIPKQKLIESTGHETIKTKLQMFIIELQNKVNLSKKSYYDGNNYYGEIDPQTHRRQGLGIYVYHYGDIYFGLWRQNSIIQGTYIFQNGDCFQGTVKKGKQGKGTYYYSNGNLYQGDWLDDLKHGQGKMFYVHGDSYDGSWQRGKRNGFGAYLFNHGTVYKGQFVNGKKHGMGTVEFTDGTKVEATWSSNHIEGRGRISYKNGDYFQGTFTFSFKQGEGLYCWGDSTKYEGNFKKDLMQGFARIKYGQNEYYEGHIFQGQREGEGFYRYKNGDTFKGEWKHDQKCSGQYTYQDGGSFQGKFTQGQMSYGVMIYPNGQSYEGEFLNGERNGLGVYRNAAGSLLFEGQWSHDKFMGSVI